jgi:hypothetical protein
LKLKYASETFENLASTLDQMSSEAAGGHLVQVFEVPVELESIL